jgi:hypothetical protein
MPSIARRALRFRLLSLSAKVRPTATRTVAPSDVEQRWLTLRRHRPDVVAVPVFR